LADDVSGMACCRKGQRHSCCHRKRLAPGAVTIGSAASCSKNCCGTSVAPLRTLMSPGALVLPAPVRQASAAPVSVAYMVASQCNPSQWQRPPPVIA
jgi:hypothetical protein